MTFAALTLAASLNYSMLGTCIVIMGDAGDEKATQFYRELAASTVTTAAEREQLSAAVVSGINKLDTLTKTRLYDMCKGVYYFINLENE